MAKLTKLYIVSYFARILSIPQFNWQKGGEVDEVLSLKTELELFLK